MPSGWGLMHSAADSQPEAPLLTGWRAPWKPGAVPRTYRYTVTVHTAGCTRPGTVGHVPTPHCTYIGSGAVACVSGRQAGRQGVWHSSTKSLGGDDPVPPCPPPCNCLASNLRIRSWIGPSASAMPCPLNYGNHNRSPHSLDLDVASICASEVHKTRCLP